MTEMKKTGEGGALFYIPRQRSDQADPHDPTGEKLYKNMGCIRPLRVRWGRHTSEPATATLSVSCFKMSATVVVAIQLLSNINFYI